MDRIAVLDFGGQYAHLIANRIRRLGVLAEIVLPQNLSSAKELKGFCGIVLSGGPQSVLTNGSPKIDSEVFDLGKPILAICYGLQLSVHTLGGKVKRGKTPEYGPAKLKRSGESKLLARIPKVSQVWMSHGDEVRSLPVGFEKIASTEHCEFAAIENSSKQIFGTQFHPEVVHTEFGNNLLTNFLKICKAKKTWTMEKFLRGEITKIKKQVGTRKVFLLVSGGVDSAVAFALLQRALGQKRVFGLLIDHGLMRKNEVEEVLKNLSKAGFDNLRVEKASGHFLAALKNVSNPEEKRRIIGRVFLRTQQKALKRLNFNPREWLLGQGTIYPDTIESAGTANSDKIKTHHNRVPEIEAMIEKGLVVEPLAELYKDEVRELGKRLKLPKKLINRHPFPGPGLAVRILCGRITRLKNSNSVEAKFRRIFKISGKVLPVRSVGVQGDARTFRHPIAIFTKIRNWSKLNDIATETVNKFSEINRVLLCFTTSSAPRSLQHCPALLTPSRIKLTQEIDAIVNKILHSNKLYQKVWQMPVVLVPVSVSANKESVILRPVDSVEAMTASFSRLPFDIVNKMVQQIQKIDGIEHVFFDLTNKPPGTIEWE